MSNCENVPYTDLRAVADMLLSTARYSIGIGDADIAVRYATAALALDPDFVEAYWCRHFAFILEGSVSDRWIANLDHVLRVEPQKPEGHWCRAAIHMTLGHADKAAFDFQDAMSLDPSWQSIYALGDEELWADSLAGRMRNRVQEEDERTRNIRVHLKCPSLSFDPKQCVDAETEASKLAGEKHAEARALLDQEQYTRAINLLTEAIQSDSSYEEYWEDRAKAYLAIGEQEEAWKDLTAIVQIRQGWSVDLTPCA